MQLASPKIAGETPARLKQKSIHGMVKRTAWTALLLLLFWKFRTYSLLSSRGFEENPIQAMTEGTASENVKAMSLISTARVSGRRLAVSLSSQEEGLQIITKRPASSMCTTRPREWKAPPESNGYLWFRANGGLNQMRAAICDMVAVARYVNATLVIPDLDKASYWSDSSEFADLFDLDHFIHSLKNEVHIVRELPDKFDKKRIRESVSLTPVSWSSMEYYQKVLLPLLKKHEVVRLNETDSRLANSSPQVPEEMQKLRCRVQYQALRFTPRLRLLSQKIVQRLRARGPFLALHLRYEMDMIAFTGCSRGCTKEEERKMTKLRYETGRWKDKKLSASKQRRSGKCPLTPEEVVLMLRALGYDRNYQIYVASGEILGSKRRMPKLVSAFPHTVSKKTLLTPEDLAPFRAHASQLAAVDYMVSLAADVFLPTYPGNMARLVEGHRRFVGHRRSVLPDVKSVVGLMDSYQSGNMSWTEFAAGVNRTQVDRMGAPKLRQQNAKNPKEEDYFYQNPTECMCGPPSPAVHEDKD